ncbi:MAG TPA: exosortase V [Rhizomicrobium sp.]|nr:exosortase V [Rhizomicrobium sp.]
MTAVEPLRSEPFQHSPLDSLADSWPLLLGFAALAIPAIGILAEQTWSNEAGAHGPLVLFTGGWLLWRQMPAIRKIAEPGRGWLVAVLIAISLFLYIVGQAFDFTTADAAGLYGVGVAIFYAKFGWRALVGNWFIFFYLLFAVPPPSIWIDSLTFPLKQLVSTLATAMLQPFGVPVVHEGVVIYVAQYQLLVEDACSGLNSLVGLMAISLLYIYLVRGSSWRYSALLAALAVPIAIIANVFRIIILILLTYFAGDAVAQGFLHFAAGIFIFVTALLLVFLLDSALYPLVSRRRQA